MPKVTQVGRRLAEALPPRPSEAVISITDRGDGKGGFSGGDARIPAGYLSIARFRFDDITDPAWASATYRAMSAGQARAMARFIVDHRGHDFLVHCEAGISRSGAVVEAILDTFPEYEDGGTHNDCKNERRPNALVAGLLRDALRRVQQCRT